MISYCHKIRKFHLHYHILPLNYHGFLFIFYDFIELLMKLAFMFGTGSFQQSYTFL